MQHDAVPLDAGKCINVYHGSQGYTVLSTVFLGRPTSSGEDAYAGHCHNTRGIYTTTDIEYARSFATPVPLTTDGAFYRFI